jgi:hypothetical protein
MLRRGKRQIRSWVWLVFLIFFVMVVPLLAASPNARAAEDQAPDELGRISGNGLVNIGIWVINVYEFNYRGGSYTFDFYMYFFWTDENITSIDWYLMNGMPSGPETKAMVDNGTSEGFRFELWRVRADLSVPLEPKDYPFDEVRLPISIEKVTHEYPYTFNWMTQSSGVDPGFKIVGWSVKQVDYTVNSHQYPMNLTSPQAVMTLVVDKSAFVAFMQTILPPLIFCIVSAFSYLFRMDTDGDFGLRIGVNTSMLITAVLFNISETSNIPPISGFNLYTTFITAVMAFLSITLIVTVFGYVEWKYNKRSDRIKRINRWGAAIALALPILIFLTFFMTNM